MIITQRPRMYRVRRPSAVSWTILAWLVVLPMARGFYDPSPQRWINRDPVGEIGQPNLYEFAVNQPLGRFDPNGLFAPPPPRPPTCHPYVVAVWVGATLVYVVVEVCTRDPEPPPPANCPTEKFKTPYQVDYEDCIEECSEGELPTRDHGYSFWKCMRRCMEEKGWPYRRQF